MTADQRNLLSRRDSQCLIVPRLIRVEPLHVEIMLLRELQQRFGQVGGAVRAMQQADRPGMALAQRLAQHRPERRQARAAGKQQQRALRPVRVVMQRTTVQLPQPQAIARAQAARRLAEGARAVTVEVEFQPAIVVRQARQ